MTAILDILRFFEAFAPAQTAMDFDNVGLLIGDKNRTVTKAVVSLDITAETVEEAAALGCELIISHHPVIFRPLKRLHTRDAAYLLARHDIAAVCMHTNLDLSDDFGVNLCLAAALGLQNVRKSACGECLFIGELAEKTDMTAFAAHTKAALSCAGLRYTDKKARVQTVAVASGAGGSDIFAAAEEGADVLVTG
ncbi:MAG: Nif3-like dinuclear metal center hexameric protein, partial [Ruminococcus sp.]|nr:Nif3-like dinuclear metal center hexameric protein [Ruminococcus sp.]